MTSYVYKITNITNDKFYIGKSNEPHQRWKDHLTISRNGCHGDGTFSAIHAAIKKYGESNFIFEIVSEFQTENEALSAEVQLITNSKEENRKIYNLTNGGDGISGYKHTEENKLKFSESRKGKSISENTKRKISEVMKKKIRSSEHKMNLSIAKLGKPASESVKIKNSIRFSGEKSNTAILDETQVKEIINLIKNGILLKTIAKIYNVHPTTISNIKTGKTWSHLHYVNEQ